MRLHILGICGTFMSGIAILAKQSGHVVTGSDINIYPPVSTQLQEQGILISEGYESHFLDKNIDCVIVGNVIKRGNALMEYVLDQHLPYISGPQWLAENVLKNRNVLAVAGTHGKTTTTSLLSWILEDSGLTPGFLIGGIPENFGLSARLGKDPYFVIEADEYDSAFFDKRSKFIHYHPDTLILNNLEYDHADIFKDLDAIKQQFHYLIRTIPRSGNIICFAQDGNISAVLKMGCWSHVIKFGDSKSEWQTELLAQDGSAFVVLKQNKKVGEVHWNLVGIHNVHNALAAIAAAEKAHVPAEKAIHALTRFKNVKRRMETKGKVKDITIYDDFAHHPTAIATTLAGLRAKVGKARMIAVIEFGSYTMRSGVHKEQLKTALNAADMVVCKSTELDWGLKGILETFKQPTMLYDDIDHIVKHLARELLAGDHVIIMSNSSFGGIHQKLIDQLERG